MSEKESMRSWPTRNFQFTLPLRYHLSPNSKTGLVICLHGYQDHALSMLRRIGWWDKDLPFQVLAINGPFPVPSWTGDGFKEAYSWYFRDSRADIMLVHPTTTAQALRALIDDLGFKDTPKVIFGFSQGGYMAPYLTSQLINVRGIIGLGCGYFREAYEQCPPVLVHAVHGDADERISMSGARADFEKIRQFGHTGAFHEVAGLTHKVEYSVEPLIRQLVLRSLSGPTPTVIPS